MGLSCKVLSIWRWLAKDCHAGKKKTLQGSFVLQSVVFFLFFYRIQPRFTSSWTNIVLLLVQALMKDLNNLLILWAILTKVSRIILENSLCCTEESNKWTKINQHSESYINIIKLNYSFKLCCKNISVDCNCASDSYSFYFFHYINRDISMWTFLN